MIARWAWYNYNMVDSTADIVHHAIYPSCLSIKSLDWNSMKSLNMLHMHDQPIFHTYIAFSAVI